MADETSQQFGIRTVGMEQSDPFGVDVGGRRCLSPCPGQRRDVEVPVRLRDDAVSSAGASVDPFEASARQRGSPLCLGRFEGGNGTVHRSHDGRHRTARWQRIAVSRGARTGSHREILRRVDAAVADSPNTRIGRSFLPTRRTVHLRPIFVTGVKNRNDSLRTAGATTGCVRTGLALAGLVPNRWGC